MNPELVIQKVVEQSKFGGKSFFGSQNHVKFLNWHGEVLAERLAKVKAGDGKFLTIAELKARLASK